MASSPSITAPNVVLTEWTVIFLFSVSRKVWPLSCPVLHRILSCLGLHRVYFHFQAPPASAAHTPSHCWYSVFCTERGDVSSQYDAFLWIFFLRRGTHRASTCVHPLVPTVLAMVSVLSRASTAMQRAVLAFESLISPKA